MLIINLLGPHRGSEKHLFVKLKKIENIFAFQSKTEKFEVNSSLAVWHFFKPRTTTADVTAETYAHIPPLQSKIHFQ